MVCSDGMQSLRVGARDHEGAPKGVSRTVSLTAGGDVQEAATERNHIVNRESSNEGIDRHKREAYTGAAHGNQA